MDFGRIFGYVLPLLPCRLAFWWSLCFGTVFDLIRSRLQGQGERFGGVSVGYAEATWSKCSHVNVAINTAEVGR